MCFKLIRSFRSAERWKTRGDRLSNRTEKPPGVEDQWNWMKSRTPPGNSGDTYTALSWGRWGSAVSMWWTRGTCAPGTQGCAFDLCPQASGWTLANSGRSSVCTPERKHLKQFLLQTHILSLYTHRHTHTYKPVAIPLPFVTSSCFYKLIKKITMESKTNI